MFIRVGKEWHLNKRFFFVLLNFVFMSLNSKECNDLKRSIFETLYPVGSIYVSMNDNNPVNIFGFGKWETIEDRFLYCSQNESKQTGGSKKITIDNLPPHKHGIVNWYDNADYNPIDKIGLEFTTDLPYMSIPNDVGELAVNPDPCQTRTTYTENEGNGVDYLPPYISVHAWYRVE